MLVYISTRRAKYAFFTSEESYRTIYRLMDFLKHVSMADSEGPLATNSDSPVCCFGPWCFLLLFSSPAPPLPPFLTFSSSLFCWFYLPSKATFPLPPTGSNRAALSPGFLQKLHTVFPCLPCPACSSWHSSQRGPVSACRILPQFLYSSFPHPFRSSFKATFSERLFLATISTPSPDLRAPFLLTYALGLYQYLVCYIDSACLSCLVSVSLKAEIFVLVVYC